MEEHSYLIIFITTPTPEEAQRIAKVLLEQKRVACVNIVSGVSSLFWWQGRIDSAQENLLIAKTEPSQLTELVALVKELHSYDVPEVIAIPIIGGNQDYLQWLGNEME